MSGFCMHHQGFATFSPSPVCLQLIQCSCVTLSQTGGQDQCEKEPKEAFLWTHLELCWSSGSWPLHELCSKYVCASHLPHWSGPDTDCRLTSQLDHQPVWSLWTYLNMTVAEPGYYHQTSSALLVWLLWDGTHGEDTALLSLLASLLSQRSLLLLLANISSQVKQLVIFALVFY